MIFRLSTHRFEFRAIDSVYFPPGKAGNVLRGALGTVEADCNPKELPSGLAEPPRPFVLRASHLDGTRFGPGETFSFNVNLFDLRAALRERVEERFTQFAGTGLGPRRGRVELLKPVIATSVELNLTATEVCRHVNVLFRTPTELKGAPSHAEVPFGVLFARIRDRISTLRSLYGEGPLSIDFKALANRADLVRTVACDLDYRDISRRSSRTGAVHGIGGFTGKAEYEGDLAEFVPWLRAAWWTGAGRYTVWGNGVIEIVIR